MTDHQNIRAESEFRLKDLEEENELLLDQLHRTQEELERYYLKSQERDNRPFAEVSGTSAGALTWVDDESLDTLAELQRLTVLVDVQKQVYQLELQNALNTKLGNILIQGTSSFTSLLAVPGKIGKIWKNSARKNPPASVGGKGFAKVISAYEAGGMDATQKLIAETLISSAMQANAFTALARKLMDSDHRQAAKAARYAYAADPKPYRLKWLAFRLHEAGEVAQAEAMLDILPPDTSFSDSETHQANRLRQEAKQVRRNDAKQKARFSERRAEIDKQLNRLAYERDKQAKQLEKRSQDLHAFKLSLEQERSALAAQQQETEKLIQEKQVLMQVQEEIARLTSEHTQGAEALKQANEQLAQEQQVLVQAQEEIARLTSERTQGAEALKKANEQLAQEKQVLTEYLRNMSRLDEVVSNTKIQNTRIEELTKSLKQRIDSGLKNTIKQIESYIGIESYLTHKNMMLPMHGWPVSPDFMLHLIEMIETRDYDLIIEFGSGTSTVLMAKTIHKIRMQHRRLIKTIDGPGIALSDGISDTSTSVTTNYAQIIPIKSWPMVVTFEHNKKCHGDTQMKLHQAGVAEFVDLIYAPLHDYMASDGNRFLYYTCEEKLAALGKSLEGRRAHILVLVDGPPGTTNHHARYPVMPIMLQHFSVHQLDVLLDDTNRKEEKEIVDLWAELLDKRSLAYEKQNLAFEKGACLLSIG
jgi:hypothetical protein